MFYIYKYLRNNQDSIDIVFKDIQVKSISKQHLSKVHFKVVSKYKRFFQLRNRFFASDLRVLFFRRSRKWRFMDVFFFRQTRERSFKFFSYKLAFMLKQLLKQMFLCNELTFKRGIINRIQNFSNRLDLVCIRVHFFTTLREARFGIKRGLILVNGVVVTYWNFYLKLFDLVNLVNNTKKFVPFVRFGSRFKFKWRIPLLLQVIVKIFRLLIQLRLWVCSFFSIFNLIFFFKNICNLLFFQVVMHVLCVFNYISFFWILCMKQIPRALIIGIYFARPFFKRKLRSFIKYIRRVRIFKMKKAKKSKKVSALKHFLRLRSRHKRVDIFMHVWRYVKYISIFTLFWFFSFSFCAFTYKKYSFTLLTNQSFLFFPRFPLFFFVFILHFLLFFNFFIHFLYWGGLFLCVDLFGLMCCIRKSDIFACFFVNKYASRRYRHVLLALAKEYTFTDFDILFFNFYKINCFSFCLFFFFNIYMFLYYSVINLFEFFRLRSLKFVNFNALFVLRTFKQVCVAKKRLSYFNLYRIAKSSVFFNLLIYFNCIDFMAFNLMFSNLSCHLLFDFFVSLVSIKQNFLKSCTYFLNNNFSILFIFFNIDNLFGLLFLYSLQRDAIYRIKRSLLRVKYLKAYNQKIFFKMLCFENVSRAMEFILLLFSHLNSFFLFLESYLSKISLLECIFIIIFMFNYCLYHFGFCNRIAFYLYSYCVFKLGRIFWNTIYNKFIFLNWYNCPFYLQFKKYCLYKIPQNFLYCNLISNFSSDVYFYKKLTSFFNNKALCIYAFKIMAVVLSVLNVYSFYKILGFKNGNKVVFVSSVFFYWLFNCSIIFCNVFILSTVFIFFYYRFILGFYQFFNVLALYSLFVFNFWVYRLFYKRLIVNRIIRRRWNFKSAPLVLTHCFSCSTFKIILSHTWKYAYNTLQKHATMSYKNSHLFLRQFFCKYVLRYYFKYNIKLFSWFSTRKVRQLQTNYFFSKSFVYYDVEYNVDGANFIYLGDSNFFIRRLQLRFNFFMTLVLRFYAHSSSLSKK